MASRILGGLLEVFTPSSSSYRVHPLVVLSLTSTISVVLFLTNHIVLLLVLLGCLAVMLSMIRNVMVLVKSIAYSIIFISPYMLSAIIIQHLSGFQSIHLILINYLRMQALTLLSIIALSLIDLVWLARVFSKISPSLGMLLALSFKLVYTISLNTKLLLELYDINLKRISRARRIILVTRATTYLSFNIMLSFMEAFYTRKHLVLGRG